MARRPLLVLGMVVVVRRRGMGRGRDRWSLVVVVRAVPGSVFVEVSAVGIVASRVLVLLVSAALVELES